MSFQFQQFNVVDENSAMKVGIDAVVLGSWINLEQSVKVLDVGAGTGIVSLMMAQRFPLANFLSIEINNDAYCDMTFNFTNSPWSNRLTPLLGDFFESEFSDNLDFIISNPPFFEFDLLDHSARELARNSLRFSFQKFFEKAFKTLNNKGKTALIYPFDQRLKMSKYALLQGFFMHSELIIRDRINSSNNRIISVFSKEQSVEFCSHLLVLKGENGNYTNQFNSLIHKFYL